MSSLKVPGPGALIQSLLLKANKDKPVAIAALLGGCLLVYFVALVIYYRWLHPLAKYPGPFWASITNLWKAKQCLSKEFPSRLCKIHRKYGHIVRIGPNDLAFDNPGAIAIYKSARKMPKSNYYNAFASVIPDIFSTTDEKHHAMRARQIGQGFTISALKNMEQLFDRHIDRLMNTVDQAAQAGSVLDLKQALEYYGFDIIAQLGFDTDANLQGKQEPSAVPPMTDHFFMADVYGQLANLLPYIRDWSTWLPAVQKVMKSRNELIELATTSVAEALERNKQGVHGTLLGTLISATDPKTGARLSKDEITAEAFVFIVGGSHTSSSSMVMLFWYLLKNPEVLKRVVAEMDANVPLKKEGGVYPHVGLDADSFLYTSACINEAFRMTPAVGMLMPRVVTDPLGQTIDGHVIPKETNCCMSAATIAHNPDIWGDDHDVYDPDRFFKGSARYNPDYAGFLLHFGQGNRQCIGRNIALMSIWKVLTTILKQYKVELADPNEELVITQSSATDKVGPLNIRVQKRVYL